MMVKRCINISRGTESKPLSTDMRVLINPALDYLVGCRNR